MSNYPPGVTGNEPQITGEWPCRVCAGEGGFRDEDGVVSCYWCSGSGLEPEEVDPPQLWQLATYHSRAEAREWVFLAATEWFNRYDPDTRQHLRKCIAAVSDRRY